MSVPTDLTRVDFTEQVSLFNQMILPAISPSLDEADQDAASGSHRQWLRLEEQRAAMRRTWAGPTTFSCSKGVRSHMEAPPEKKTSSLNAKTSPVPPMVAQGPPSMMSERASELKTRCRPSGATTKVNGGWRSAS
jgi:hypothetical protein